MRGTRSRTRGRSENIADIAERYADKVRNARHRAVPESLGGVVEMAARTQFQAWQKARFAEGKDVTWNPLLGKEWDDMTDEEKADARGSVSTVIGDMSRAGYDVRHGHQSVDRERFANDVAEVAHDAWSAGKLADGWSYAPVRDHDERHHPCLLPYGMLNDSERQYDIDEAKSVYDSITGNGNLAIVRR